MQDMPKVILSSSSHLLLPLNELNRWFNMTYSWLIHIRWYISPNYFMYGPLKGFINGFSFFSFLVTFFLFCPLSGPWTPLSRISGRCLWMDQKLLQFFPKYSLESSFGISQLKCLQFTWIQIFFIMTFSFSSVDLYPYVITHYSKYPLTGNLLGETKEKHSLF